MVLPSDLIFNVKKSDALDTTDEKFNYEFNLGFKLKRAYEKLVEKKIIQSEKYKAFYDRSHKKVVFDKNCIRFHKKVITGQRRLKVYQKNSWLLGVDHIRSKRD